MDTVAETVSISSPLLRLPAELRCRILAYLMPSRKEIKVRDGWCIRSYRDPGLTGGEQYGNLCHFRHEDEKCDMAILAVNRQVYDEACHIMYNRIFRVVITEGGFSFLKEHWPPNFNQFIYFPFHKARKIVVQVQAPIPGWESASKTADDLYRVRKNISTFTYLLSRFLLKDVTVEFEPAFPKEPWPFENGQLINTSELPISDLELLLQPIRFLYCTTATILLPLFPIPIRDESINPWPSEWDVSWHNPNIDLESSISEGSSDTCSGSEDDDSKHFEAKGFDCIIIDFEEPDAFFKEYDVSPTPREREKERLENTDPEAVKLIEDSIAIMTDPEYEVEGDIERLRSTTLAFQQRWPGCGSMWGVRKFGWDEATEETDGFLSSDVRFGSSDTRLGFKVIP